MRTICCSTAWAISTSCSSTDAAKAAEALDIALTKRGKHLGEDIPMCGVPVHAAEAYLEKLIRKGYPRRGLRADRRPGRGQEARLQIGGEARSGAAGDAGHPDRGRAAGSARLQPAGGAGPQRRAISRWPAPTCPPASFRSRASTRDEIAAELARLAPARIAGAGCAAGAGRLRARCSSRWARRCRRCRSAGSIPPMASAR